MMFPFGIYALSKATKSLLCSGRVSNDSKIMSRTRFGSKLKQPISDLMISRVLLTET